MTYILSAATFYFTQNNHPIRQTGLKSAFVPKGGLNTIPISRLAPYPIQRTGFLTCNVRIKLAKADIRKPVKKKKFTMLTILSNVKQRKIHTFSFKKKLPILDSFELA